MGMGMGSPFGEDVMTIIMGINPDDPGMHGPCDVPGPTSDAVGLVTKIRDMCDEWLRSAGKDESEESAAPPTEVGDTDQEE